MWVVHHHTVTAHLCFELVYFYYLSISILLSLSPYTRLLFRCQVTVDRHSLDGSTFVDICLYILMVGLKSPALFAGAYLCSSLNPLHFLCTYSLVALRVLDLYYCSLVR